MRKRVPDESEKIRRREKVKIRKRAKGGQGRPRGAPCWKGSRSREQS